MDTKSDVLNFSGMMRSKIDLPSAPLVIQRLHSLIASDETGSQEIAAVVETDQAFTARILKLVNSPFYGFARQITSVEEAVTMLGLNAVHQLLLTTSVLQTLGSGSHVLNAQDFWRHSFGVGVIAKHLLISASDDIRSEALSCGILHDIGRLLLLRADQERFAAFLDDGSRVFSVENETEFFGIDHQELGAMLAEKWNFPGAVAAAIRYHHTPDQAQSHKRLVATISVANLLCHGMRIGDSGDQYVSGFSPEAWKLLQLDMNQLEKALRNALDDIDDANRILGDLQ